MCTFSHVFFQAAVQSIWMVLSYYYSFTELFNIYYTYFFTASNTHFMVNDEIVVFPYALKYIVRSVK